VRALVVCGADVHTADKKGATPVWAAESGHTACVQALHEFGADVNAADKNGDTPVWIAAFFGRTETVRALVQECCVDVNTANKNGVTPVLVDVKRPFTETVRTLVECGADPWIANEDGWCPLEVAAEAGATGLLWTMLRKSAVEHRRLPRREQRMVCGDASAMHVLAAVAGRAGHAETEAMLEWMEGLESANPEYKDANDAARRGGFECPVCLESTGNVFALVPCGHHVCRGCWKQTSRRAGDCPMCRAIVLLAAQQDLWPHKAPLYARFCVRL
jgi:hypothetical protein